MKTAITCDSCGISFLCSKECVTKGKTKATLTNCATCDKQIMKAPGVLASSKTGNVYCSKKCAVTKNNTLFKTGPNHPNYKSGQGTYRERALAAKPNECVVCGYSDSRVLEVYHIDEDRSNNDLSNLVILCPTHHTERHRGILELEQYLN